MVQNKMAATMMVTNVSLFVLISGHSDSFLLEKRVDISTKLFVANSWYLQFAISFAVCCSQIVVYSPLTLLLSKDSYFAVSVCCHVCPMFSGLTAFLYPSSHYTLKAVSIKSS